MPERRLGLEGDGLGSPISIGEENECQRPLTLVLLSNRCRGGGGERADCEIPHRLENGQCASDEAAFRRGVD